MFEVILVKLIATASVVIGVSLAVSKLGPRLGGILAGTPIILGPGYYFMLQERPVEFIQSAALSTLHALVGTLVFSICFVMTAGRMSALASLGLATACWIPSTLVFFKTPGGVWGAVLLYGVVLLIAEGVRLALKLGQPVVVARAGWFDVLLRGLLAGVLVSIATTVATKSGPLLSGVLVGFPVGLSTISWTLHERYGSHVARATVTIAQKGMLSLVAFCVVLAFTVGKLPPMLTFTLSLVGSLVVSAALFLTSQWQHKRAYVALPLPEEKS
ncbi:hypothetical protein [Marinobacter antarcticus]|uniref:Uncharacterized protein n=1 Tax=Marinobacter antarcticus TaxID=564117 RepID=A0A831QZK4_9GAMM|nr:hypothetical protein [Marinobacter antarcticus]HEA51333.1 hypothetical protein [Marinobacter antarcticus]